MTVRINGDAISILSRHNFSQNVQSLSNSVEKLSSGLRINGYADDPATSSIASKLNSQALSFGQAARNASDAVSVMQITDDSLAEAINIVNVIRTKAVQGAQSTLTSSTRSALQQDINTLLEELDLIVDTTSFNEQRLLTGMFSNKKFQIGANANEAVNISFPSAKETKIGHLGTGVVTLSSSSGGEVNFNFSNSETGEMLRVNSLTISYGNDPEKGMGGIADYINRYTSDTGISAVAIVESTSASPVSAGATGASFSINDVEMGIINVKALDADNSLVNSINALSMSHGVTARTNSTGQLFLQSDDGRSIKVEDTGTIGLSADELTTYGQLNIIQNGPYKINLNDLSEGFAVAFSSNMSVATSVTTTIDSSLAAGSVLGNGSALTVGWTAGALLSGSDIGGDIVTTQSSELFEGSVLASGSIIANGSQIGGTGTTANTVTTQDITILQSGSTLKSGSVITEGSYLTNDITTASGVTTKGTVLLADATLTADLSLSQTMLLLSGSSLASNSSFTAGSVIGNDFTVDGTLDVNETMTILAGSTIIDDDGATTLAAGSTIGGNVLFSTSKTVTQEMIVKSGSTLSSATQFSLGSTIGGATIVDGSHTTIEDLYIETGSILSANSIIAGGTEVTNTISSTSGSVDIGTILPADIVTFGSNTLDSGMLLKTGSVVADGSTLAANSRNETGVQVTGESVLRLIDLSVLTTEDASTGIIIADQALKDLERIRAAAGAYHSQFESSISRLGETQMQLSEARSKMIDIDFASEVENLTKMQVLVQSSAFALTQANAVPQNIFNILQGGADQKLSDFFISAANQMIVAN